MKALINIFAVVALLCGMTACSQEDKTAAPDDFVSLDQNITMTRTISVPVTRAGVATDFSVQLTATMDEATEQITDLEVTPISDDVEFIAEFNRQFPDEFREAMIAEFGENYMDLDEIGAHTNGATADCITGCYDRFTDANGKKKPGRGSCKFGCYVDAVVEVAKEIAKNLDITQLFR